MLACRSASLARIPDRMTRGEVLSVRHGEHAHGKATGEDDERTREPFQRRHLLPTERDAVRRVIRRPLSVRTNGQRRRGRPDDGPLRLQKGKRRAPERSMYF
jgi:hypothetical protein